MKTICSFFRSFIILQGGMGVLFACFPLIHVAMGVFFVTSMSQASNNGSSPPVAFGAIFIVVGLFFFLFGQIVAWSTIYSGRLLRHHEKHTFSFVLACIMCIFMPIGTVLGIFTILVLQRPSVKHLYEEVENGIS